MYFKKVLFIVSILLFSQKLYSQEYFQMEQNGLPMVIEIRHFELVEMVYHVAEAANVDLSEHKIGIYIDNNTLHVRFFKPDPNWMGYGPPPGSYSIHYEVDIVSGEIINIRSFR